MEFSELYKQSNSNLVTFSPDGNYLAVAVEHRLIVRSSSMPKTIHRVYSCVYDTAPHIQAIEWSSDSAFLLTASYEMNRVDVWSLADETWRCSIVDEVSRIESAMWTPHGRHILTFSELDLRLSIWSIENPNDRRFIQFPKSRVPPVFHPSGDYMAVAQRHDYHDYIGLYNTESWTMVREIEVADTVDMEGLKWSPDGLHLVGWDLAANFCAVIANVGGVVKRAYREEDEVLGVRTCAWAPSAQLLALGGYDQKIRVLNNLTWRPIATLVHRTQDIRAPVDMFTEVEIPHSLAQESEKVLSENGVRKRTRFDLEPMPASIRVTVPADVHRAVGERKAGVSVLEFSVEGELLVSVCDGMPNAVWVWEVAGMRLISVVQTLRPVRSCLWSPLEKTLAIATGGPTVCLWKMGDGCVMYESPSSATATASALQWNPNGESLAIMSKGLFMLGFGG